MPQREPRLGLKRSGGGPQHHISEEHAAVVWVGGMFFAYVVLRPAAGALAPETRLELWHRVFGRFFPWVWLSIVVLLASGYGMIFFYLAGEAAEIEEDHAVAGCEQDYDAQPHPREEAAKDAVPKLKPRLGRKRPRGRAQHHISEEHAADPDDGGEDMERDEKGHGATLAQEPRARHRHWVALGAACYCAALMSFGFFLFFFLSSG